MARHISRRNSRAEPRGGAAVMEEHATDTESKLDFSTMLDLLVGSSERASTHLNVIEEVEAQRHSNECLSYLPKLVRDTAGPILTSKHGNSKLRVDQAASYLKAQFALLPIIVSLQRGRCVLATQLPSLNRASFVATKLRDDLHLETQIQGRFVQIFLKSFTSTRDELDDLVHAVKIVLAARGREAESATISTAGRNSSGRRVSPLLVIRRPHRTPEELKESSPEDMSFMPASFARSGDVSLNDVKWGRQMTRQITAPLWSDSSPNMGRRPTRALWL